MTPVLWAILLRPIALPILFFAIVAPIAWALYRIFPDGRLKVMLFRSRTGPHATRRDKGIMTISTIAAYAAFFIWIAIISGMGP